MKNLTIITAIGFIVLTTSCTSTTKNNVFAGLQPTSFQYKKELIKQLLDHGTSNLTFTFDGLATLAGKNYMYVSINGSDMQAHSLVLINDWHKLEGIKHSRGISYQGAELKNLRLDVSYDKGELLLVYRDLEKIVD